MDSLKKEAVRPRRTGFVRQRTVPYRSRKSNRAEFESEGDASSSNVDENDGIQHYTEDGGARGSGYAYRGGLAAGAKW